MKKRKPKAAPTPSESLRLWIEESGLTLYRVAKDSGVPYATLHRFMTGKRAVGLPAFDKLCAFLKLELRQR